MKKKPDHPLFEKEMKKTHTILLPMMLPVHFAFLEQILRQYGYKTALLNNDGPAVVEAGLKNVHNDTCYPALLVIGQMIDALKNGGFDSEKTALMITQTGGGCRASNYIFLLRKALENCGMGQVPVISLNAAGLDKSPGFHLTIGMLVKFVYALVAGDFLMLLKNQCLPYEKNSGDTEKVVEKWTRLFLQEWKAAKVVRYGRIKRYYPQILADFAAIPKTGEKKVRVGIVGEIYMKYSPMGNNYLEDFLLAENAEPVVPGVMDFCLYCINNAAEDRTLYGGKFFRSFFCKVGYDFFIAKQNDMIEAIEKHGVFDPPSRFGKTRAIAEEYIGRGVKMGEGWLLTAEMVELIENGVPNIVCTQPFGCLPNHIVGKGMINKIKAKNPAANIVAIDYDPGASVVNQQNRIKMMLANAQQRQKEQPTAVSPQQEGADQDAERVAIEL